MTHALGENLPAYPHFIFAAKDEYSCFSLLEGGA
jgi:hypothetical protein